MAVTIANITQNFTTAGVTSVNTASVTPGSNKLELLSVASRTGITTNPNQPTATGNGLTWVVITSVVYDNTSSSRRRLTTFRAMGASPSTGAITIDFGGQTQTTIDWILDELTGTDTSGTNGSGAIVQSNSNSDTSATGSSLTVTLSSSPTSGFVYGAFANGNGTNTSTAGTGFTKSGDITDSADIRTTTEYQAANDQSIDMSWSAASELGGIGLEILAASAGTTNSSHTMLMGMGM